MVADVCGPAFAVHWTSLRPTPGWAVGAKRREINPHGRIAIRPYPYCGAGYIHFHGAQCRQVSETQCLWLTAIPLMGYDMPDCLV